MSTQTQLDSRLGRTELAYSDAGTARTALMVLGVALGGGGLLITAITTAVVLDAHTGARDRNDAKGMLVFSLFLVVPGLLLFAWALREKLGKPAWYLCEHGLVRVTTRGSSRLVFWRDVNDLTVVQLVRYGQPVGLRLRVNGRHIHVPDQTVAQRAQQLWIKANPAATRAA